jgi:hypothetical protein
MKRYKRHHVFKYLAEFPAARVWYRRLLAIALMTWKTQLRPRRGRVDDVEKRNFGLAAAFFASLPITDYRFETASNS